MIMSVIGTGLQVVGSIQQGKAQQAALNFEAKQREAKAKEERAAGQREMLEKRAETERVLSRQAALAAASGAGVETPTVLDIYEETASRGRYLENVAQYGGESRARGQLDQAAAARMRGKAAAQGGILDGLAAGFSGLGKAFG
jgi:hypothetical protein